MVRELPAESILLTLESPAFAMTAPDVRNRHLMPPDIARAVAANWDVGHFPAAPVRFARLCDVFVVSEGLVFDRDGQLFAATVTQHTDAEIGEATAALAVTRDQAVRHAGLCVLGTKRGKDNYGHWMIEMLPRLFLADRHLGRPGLRHVVPDGLAAMGRVIANTTDRLGITADRRIVVGPAPAFFSELVVVDGLARHGGFLSPLVMPCLDALAAQAPVGGPASC